ncbi:MAG: ArsR/SmtB family transcription factor [Promethearchaeota archaeon]
MLSRKIANFFSALSDETRIKILAILYEKPLSVNEIKDRIENISLPGISYQLKILQNMDIIRYKKIGRKKIFHLSDEHVTHILNDVIVHLSPEGPCDGQLNCSDKLNLQLVMK